jgi:restriction system protein
MINIDIEKMMNRIQIIDSNINYWFIRTQGGDYYTDFQLNNYVGIGFNEISLSDIKEANNSSEALKEKVIRSYNELNNAKEMSQPGKIANQLLRFANGIRENDMVVVPSESSQFLLVGVATGSAYELSDDEIESIEESDNYKKSNYRKRLNIRWIGSFDRDKADSKLYKMIFSQHTLSDINSYKQYINRALFPVYIEDDQLHLTFEVTNTENINGLYLGQFIYFYTTIYNLLFPGDALEVKVNVQSPGPIESISKNVGKGLVAFSVVAALLTAPYGGSFKIGNDIFGSIELQTPGLVSGKTEVEVKKAKLEGQDLANDKQRLQNIEEAINLAVKLKVPVSQLGIELPKDLVEEIQDEVDKRIAEEKKNPINEGSQSSENTNSDEK